jgi:D-alanine-D-alanine ligase
VIPADISDEYFDEIKNDAKLLYLELGAFGVIRFDFIIDNDDNLFLNEVNTVPGSMANYLFDKHKYTYAKLIDRLVDLSFLRNEKRIKYTAFKSDILNSGLKGLKK